MVLIAPVSGNCVLFTFMINPVTSLNVAELFNCKLVDQVSDTLMTSV